MVIFLAVGVVWALLYIPPDYQQSYTTRILVIHVAVAGTSLAFFPLMAVAGTITLVWRMKLADMVAKNAAPLGAWFSFITLATGSLWGSVMWGTWWEWSDARLVSMLFQFFLLVSVVALRSALEDNDTAARACALLSIVGCINVVIIKYSVEWWNVLHQPSSPLSMSGESANGPEFWVPTVVMIVAVYLFFAVSLILATRNEILQRERKAAWVQELVSKT
jgi:heme exporter protein C